MKNLLVSVSGFGAFVLGVMLSFDVTGIIGSRLLPKSGASVIPTSSQSDLQNLRDDWHHVGDDLRAAMEKAHEQS